MIGEKLGYRSSLNGLRGIAVALVVGVHGFGWPRDGQIGVDLFFVLSGFLITTLLLEERDRTGSVSFRAFYKRRVRRLLPALVVMLTVFAMAAEFSTRAVTNALLGLGFSMNVARTWNLYPTENGIGHLWSLAAEDQFYLLWPILLIIVARAGRVRAAAILLVVLAAMTLQQHVLYAGGETPRLEFGPDTRATGLPIGCLLALAYASATGRRLLRAASRILLPLAVLVIAWISLPSQPPWLFEGGATVFGLAVAVVMARALDQHSWTARALSFGPLVGLGAISYSLYLWHLPILVWTGGEGHPGKAVLPMLLAIAVAALSYRFIEQPFRGRRATRPIVSSLVAVLVPSGAWPMRRQSRSAPRGEAHVPGLRNETDDALAARPVQGF